MGGKYMQFCMHVSMSGGGGGGGGGGMYFYTIINF